MLKLQLYFTLTFIQCGIDTEKLLTMKKQQETKMKRKNEKEKRKIQKMAKKLVGDTPKYTPNHKKANVTE